jgi:hypothetical protein
MIHGTPGLPRLLSKHCAANGARTHFRQPSAATTKHRSLLASTSRRSAARPSLPGYPCTPGGRDYQRPCSDYPYPCFDYPYPYSDYPYPYSDYPYPCPLFRLSVPLFRLSAPFITRARRCRGTPARRAGGIISSRCSDHPYRYSDHPYPYSDYPYPYSDYPYPYSDYPYPYSDYPYPYSDCLHRLSRAPVATGVPLPAWRVCGRAPARERVCA